LSKILENSRELVRPTLATLGVAAKKLKLILLMSTLFLFVFFSFFDRGGRLVSSFGVSAPQIVLVCLIIFLFLYFATKRSVLRRGYFCYYLAFFVYVFFVILILFRYASSIHFPLALQFHKELFFCVLISILGFVIGSGRAVSVNHFSYIVIGAGCVYFGYAFAEAVESFNGNRYDFSESRNYFASAMAIAGIFCIVHLMSPTSFRPFFRTSLFFGCLAVSLSAIFMSGTRSAIFSIALLGSIIFMARARVIFNKINFIFLFLMASLIPVLVSDNLAVILGLRFSGDFIFSAFRERLLLWMAGLEIDSVNSAFFGRPFLYETFDPDHLAPHNVVISSIRFSGILVSGIFLFFLVPAVLRSISALTFSSRIDKELALAGGAFLVVLIYASVSGNMTRIWHFYLCLGIFLGLSSDRNGKRTS
jgi:hypothetical protein